MPLRNDVCKDLAMSTGRPKFAFDLAIASILGVALLLLSFIRIAGDAGSAAFGGKIIEATLSQPVWGTALASHLSFFAFALVLVHLFFGIACFLLGQLSRAAWPSSQNSRRSWILAWFLLLSAWILVANASWFPSSSLGSPYARVAAANWGGVTLLGTISLLVAALMTSSAAFALYNQRNKLPSLKLKHPVAIAGVIVSMGLMTFTPNLKGRTSNDPAKPHVILIGLDSLRTDAVTGSSSPLAPNVRAFLDSSTVFIDTLTPLARTFPAWVSIVSGRHPHTTGAVINLFPRERIHTGNTLPDMLRESGYKTVYAIDEVRFSNLDTSYGFDEMIAPPIGSADFLLGFFSDTPLSNLLVNTWVGAHLFPYAHGNRAATITYNPDTFVDQLDREISFDQPTFLALHMTLGHWPYSWATSRLPASRPDGRPDGVAQYAQAVARLDQQFDDVLNILRKRGALENAIVVVLSDHGESLGELEDLQMAEKGTEGDAAAEIYGHGTNIFAQEQYRVVLGMRSFGEASVSFTPGASIDAPASLEDIAPTLADALGLKSAEPFDGVSLMPIVRGEVDTAAMGGRIRFTETEFNPPGVSLGQAISASALRDASEYYRIDPESDRILIREEFLGDILANRQYAASRNGKMLALVPVQSGPGHHAIFLNGPAAEPVWIIKPGQLEGDPDTQDLWVALRNRFPLARRPIVPLTGS